MKSERQSGKVMCSLTSHFDNFDGCTLGGKKNL